MSEFAPFECAKGRSKEKSVRVKTRRYPSHINSENRLAADYRNHSNAAYFFILQTKIKTDETILLFTARAGLRMLSHV